jgi:gamma-glutamyltranspeptidase / glutathione hydrolase
MHGLTITRDDMFTTRPEIAGTFGVATSTHWIGSQVAMAVLERGGNAFDAAAAAGFVLQVAEPHLNGPGGDVPIILHDARTLRQHVICGQGVSPRHATIGHFQSLGLDLVPATGHLPLVVPGSFDAWCLLVRDWGTWELSEVLSYAIGYARNGVHVVPNLAAAIESMRELFTDHWHTSAEVFLPSGEVPAAGSLFARPALAQTWERLLTESRQAANREARINAARRAWLQGFIAESVGKFVTRTPVMDVSGTAHVGLLDEQDCAEWSATVEEPLRYDYHGTTALKCGPWSQGPVFLQQLALLAQFDVAPLDPLDSGFVHLVTECAKLAYADREAYYGDPLFAKVPLETLLSRSYNAQRAQLVGREASIELRPGAIEGYTARIDVRGPVDAGTAAGAGEPTLAKLPLPSQAGVGEPTLAKLGVKRGDTCHIDVIDRWGNIVSATPSGGWLQSSPVVPGLGFGLSTRGQMFSLTEGHPNALAPRKRPRTTLTPSMALRDGRAWMAFGTPGGEQQDQWSLTFFLRMVHHGLDIQQAIDMPSFHSEHWPSSFWPRTSSPGKLVLEGRYPDAVMRELAARKHVVEKGGDWSEGRLSAARLESGGRMYAGANPRGMQGYAVGR